MNKKIIIILIVLLFICGCNKNEKTIYEYYVTVDNIDIKVKN